jgi:Ser-tRNA(Ala) deacylase AlaX
MKTSFLFHEDAYLTECTAKVIALEANKVVLDRTCFYAFSGGQQSDSGTIGASEVIHAEKKEDFIEYTLAENPSFVLGDELEVKIDSEKRARLRRLHTALHVVGYVFEKEQNMPLQDIIGSNVEEHKGRLDYELNEPLSSLLPELERKVNELFTSDHKVEMKDQGKGRFLWICEEMEVPCGGCHVKNLHEVGLVKLKRKNIGSGKERIEVTLVEP